MIHLQYFWSPRCSSLFRINKYEGLLFFIYIALNLLTVKNGRPDLESTIYKITQFSKIFSKEEFFMITTRQNI